MNVTWEMVAGFAVVLAGMGSGFAWLARKFDRLSNGIGKLDKKKVSHKTCLERRRECSCAASFNPGIKKR